MQQIPKWPQIQNIRLWRMFAVVYKTLVIFAETRSAQAMFRGREGLKYQLASQGGQSIITSQDKISLVFKTRKSSALLYYNGKLSSPQSPIVYCWVCKSKFSNNISWCRLAGRSRVWVKHEAQNTNTSHTSSLYIVGSWIVSKPQTPGHKVLSIK